MADPRWLASMEYEQAEWHYRQGSITQAEWDAYRHVWRISAPRFSHIAERDAVPPTDPATLEIVAAMRGAVQSITSPRHAAAGGDLCFDDGSGCCGACGVSLGDCRACDGRGYHRAGCPESDEDMAPFGREKTARECILRARWERRMARWALRQPYGRILAKGHLRAARDYERLSKAR